MLLDVYQKPAVMLRVFLFGRDTRLLLMSDERTSLEAGVAPFPFSARNVFEVTESAGNKLFGQRRGSLFLIATIHFATK